MIKKLQLKAAEQNNKRLNSQYLVREISLVSEKSMSNSQVLSLERKSEGVTTKDESADDEDDMNCSGV